MQRKTIQKPRKSQEGFKDASTAESKKERETKAKGSAPMLDKVSYQ